MKNVKFISDTVTSRGVFRPGAEVALEDAEADSCIKHGLAELVSAPSVPPVTPSAPAVQPAAAAGLKKKL